jgi:DNA repair exonuclease SbcCD ATPase subunit
MEMSQLLVGIDEKITGLQEKADSLDFKDIIENSNKNISDRIDALSQKLDTIAIQTQPEIEHVEAEKEPEIDIDETLDFGKTDLASQVDEIKENINKQAQLLENLKVLDKLNSLSKLDGIDAIQENVKEILSKFDGKITSMQEAVPVTQEEATGLNAELEKVKGELLECILNVFDQISFVSEAEDIKDFVSEQADGIKKYAKNQTAEIKQFVNGQLNGIKQLDIDVKDILDGQSEQVGSTIKSALGDNFDNIISSLNTLNEKAETSTGSLDDIKQNIEYVKAHVLALHEEAQSKAETSDTDEDAYTLQDVETDIAKLRLVLNEIAEASKKTEEETDDSAIDSFSNLEYLDKLNSLDKMNEDLMSISTRTNKLLLNSDESYNALKTNLDTFKDVVSTLDKKVQYMDTTDINKRIEHKLEKVNALVQTSVKSDKIFNKALMYLAEWVDTASENMNSITERVEKVSELDELKKSITELKKALPESNAEKLLEEINNKFESQQEYIARLETKIEKLTAEKKSAKAPKADVEAIVNAVVEKLNTTTGDKKSEAKLAKKVDGIEKQLTELTDGIKKLTSYVDE